MKLDIMKMLASRVWNSMYSSSVHSMFVGLCIVVFPYLIQIT